MALHTSSPPLTQTPPSSVDATQLQTRSALTLKSLQAGSGLLIAVFVAAHLGNTALAIFGPDVYNAAQSLLRLGYQQVVVELLLLAAILVHAVVGVLRMKREPKRALSARARWHRVAGIFLMLVILGHIGAVRGASFLFGVFPGFEGLSFTLNAWPGYFYPYYLALALAGFYHMVNGVPIALGRLLAVPGLIEMTRLRSRSLWIVCLAATVVMVLALLSLGGALFEIADPFDNPFARLAERLLDA